MRRIRRAIAELQAWVLVAFLALIPVALASASTPAFSADSDTVLRLHYHRPDGDYTAWNVWCWPEAGQGQAFALDQRDAFGACATMELPESPMRVGFLIRKGEWEAKDFDQDRFVDLTVGAVTDIWVISGDATVGLAPTKIDRRIKVHGAFLDDAKTITLALSHPLDPREMTDGLTVVDRRDARRALRVQSIAGDALVRLTLAREVAADELAQLEVCFKPALFGEIPPVTVYARGVLELDAWTPSEATRFGAFCTSASTRFATWSPVSDAVELLLYEPFDATSPTRTITLTRGAKGAWESTVPGDLHQVAYRYRFTNYGQTHEAPDMWAFAANSDSTRTIVVDLARLEPPNFTLTPAPVVAHQTDEILYELHVRDFSIHKPEVLPAQRGTYLGLTDTTHLKELGVTAVHLLPIHDFSAKTSEYNWGYWTTLFNVPESNYATDPADPTRAVTELRTAITALHHDHLRVILDVVYNHTSDASAHSPLGAPVPYYFFRTTPDGRLTNDAGTGNSIADERPMARKFILDSLEHWLRAYRVDGFRFDLLGTHNPATVRAICARVKAIRPDATLYGEPWTGGGAIRFGKGAQRGLPIAVFNDHLRNAIRGDLDGTAVGFATGVGGDDAAIRRGIAGSIDDFTEEPSETINYADAHDNLCLWDKIERTQPSVSDSIKRSMQRLALGIVLTSQGVPFLHGGSEFARTKQGNHNSYNAGDAINALDWSRAKEYREITQYTAGLIALRRAHSSFRLQRGVEVRRALKFLTQGRTVVFTLDGSVANDPWPQILVAYNDEPEPTSITLPPGGWEVVVDEHSAGTATIRVARDTTVLPPYSLFVAHTKP